MAKRKLPSGFTKRKDGTLELKFTIDGKRYSVYGKSVKECKEKETAKRKKIADGLTERENISLATYYKEWQDGRRMTKKVKESTIFTQDGRFERINKVLGKKRLIKILPHDIQKFQKYLKVDCGLSEQTVNLHMDLLKSIFNSAVKRRYIPYNPCDDISPMKTENKNVETDSHRCISERDRKLFFQYGQDSYYLEFFQMLLQSGMRTGELASLTWDDIDYENNVIHITKTVSRIGTKDFIIDTPKSKHSIRDIPLSDAEKEILCRWRDKYELYHGNIRRFDKRIFPTSNGTGYVRAQNLVPIIRNILKKVEAETEIHIEYFAPHAFRDTFGTEYIKQGGSVETLCRVLGHSNPTITYRYYVKPTMEMIACEAKKIQLAM